MNLQQGRGSLADSFISRTAVGTGSAVALYTVPTADQNSQPPILPTTTLVKSIRLSNQTGGAVTTTVSFFDNSNSDLEVPLYKDSLADGTEQEVLTQPFVMEKADAIKLTGLNVTILVSMMEIT
jgi:hypothetical protein